MRETRTIRPQLALEMTMRDVLGNLEEMVSTYGYMASDGCFEILAIEKAVVLDAVPRHQPPRAPRAIFSAQQYHFPTPRQVA
jgi:hypothetical protein